MTSCELRLAPMRGRLRENASVVAFVRVHESDLICRSTELCRQCLYNLRPAPSSRQTWSAPQSSNSDSSAVREFVYAERSFADE